METEIKKKISLNDMKSIFDNHANIVNIRYYECISNVNFNEESFDTKLYFKIKIRHNESEDPKVLFNNAIKKLK